VTVGRDEMPKLDNFTHCYVEGDKICRGKLLALGVTVVTIDFTMNSNCTSGVVLLCKPSNTISRPSYFPVLAHSASLRFLHLIDEYAQSENDTFSFAVQFL